nr:reverse transcriptase domain-containing protein [Tanacetum cinerariifolium]
MLPRVYHEFLLWGTSNRSAKTRYNTNLARLLPKQIYLPCVVDWGLLNNMGCAEEIQEMLKIKVYEIGGQEEIFNDELRTKKMIKFRLGGRGHTLTLLEFAGRLRLYHSDEINDEVFEFITRIAKRVGLLAEEVLNSLSALTYCKELNATTLRELIDSNWMLIVEDPTHGVLRVAMPRGPYLKVIEPKTQPEEDEPPEVELKEVPPHLEYAFLGNNGKWPVIIVKDLSFDEKTDLLNVLKTQKKAIASKLTDIKGINPEFCSHKILLEEKHSPKVQCQRKVNPKIHDVIKKEVERLLDAGLIYPISDSPWVSPIHCVPKKGGMTVIKNDENELVPTRLVTGWRVCIDYRKLNEATRKDHFPLPFTDQMLERLARNVKDM